MHISELEEICPEVTRRTLQRDLNNLIELNLVRLKGAARQSNYELAKWYYDTLRHITTQYCDILQQVS